ncbi:RNA-binding protein 7 [Neocloeon triangulifer]|uniref:RNA-binding protein 7 n=1 Tax=Neocloeon triangulifer TaxID=2078957 RepID=UPI00286EDAE4|nr:RNA-binding protein 7 [Neocloeon triangulifer]XP_059487172.1 RNA-binding protein 7 [Neocloeon triangulifer]
MDDERKRSLFVGNLATPQTTEALLHELFLQVGPVQKVVIPKNKQGNGGPANYGFVTFKHESSVLYATNVLAGSSLFGRPLKLQLRDGGAGSTPQQSPVTPRHPQQHQDMYSPQMYQQHNDRAVYEHSGGRHYDRSQERNRYQDRPQERYHPQERPRDSRRRQQHPYQNQQQGYQRHNRSRR